MPAFAGNFFIAELLSVAQLGALFAHLLQGFAELRQARLFLFDHGRRGAFDEAGVRQLAVGLGHFAFQARDLLVQAHALGGHVDLDVQHQAAGAHDLHRRAGVGQGVQDLDFAQLGQRRQVGGVALERRASPWAHSGTFWAGDRFISPRSARTASTWAFSSATSASAAVSTASGLACG